MLSPLFVVATSLILVTAWTMRRGAPARLQVPALIAVAMLAVPFLLPTASTTLLRFAIWLATACLIAQAGWLFIVRDTAVSGSAQAARLRILAGNVLSVRGGADALLAGIRKLRPDILVLAETDAWWEARLDTLSDLMPHAARCPLDALYGLHVYARIPLDNIEVRYLAGDDIPSIHAWLRTADDQRTALHVLHPRAPGLDDIAAPEHDDPLLHASRLAHGTDLPIVIAGNPNPAPHASAASADGAPAGLEWPLEHLLHNNEFSLIRSRIKTPAAGIPLALTELELRLRTDTEHGNRAPAGASLHHRTLRRRLKPG